MSSKKYPWRAFALLLFVILLTACGGGGGGSASSGVTSSSITARGVITGFGSVYVNGVRYHTGSSSFTLDDNPGLESDLRLGMVVTVTGTRNDDATGDAGSIVFDNELQGPVANLVTDADGVTKTFTVLGISVTVDRVSTSFHDITFDALANDDLVEVSGFYDGSLVLNATYLERKSGFVPGVSEVELKGTVSGSGAGTFQLNGINVIYDPSGVTTDLSRLPGGVSDGQFVEVKGTLDVSGDITATRIALEDNGFDDNIDKVSLEGIITDYVDDSDFRISGVPVDASSATISPASMSLGNGVKVEAEGPMINGVLVAISVEARSSNDVVVEAIVSSVSSGSGSVTLNLINGSVEAFTDSRTRMEDKTKAVASLSLADLANGDFLEVRGFIDDSGNLLATEIRRDDPDDVIVQAPIEGFVTDTSLTLLGVTFFTSGATQFQDSNDAPISGSSFYGSLTIGTLVKIKDSQPGDGTANEAELEQ